MLPNFFIVGANKGGSTSVYRYLNTHPEIFMSAVKEPSYFVFQGKKPASPFTAGIVTSREEYEALFDDVDGEKVIGEASTAYLRSRTAPHRIHDEIPHAKVMAILRDPSDRARSAHAFHVSRGFEPMQSLEAAVDDELENESWRMYVRNGLYADGIARWFEVFGADQVKVWLYEDLRDDPLRMLRETFEWLDVDPTFTPDVSRRYNTTRVPRSRAVNGATVRRSRLKSAVRTITPPAARRWVARRARKPNQSAPEVLAPELRRRLVQVFEPDIREVAKLIDRDLSHWLQ